ncbi:MAG: GNAT family N-acetyltransferase [Eubacteriaceae bacterium]|nr:GNAT family N-acetyltransferase [Eubacteriaceae bacterium]
MLTVRQALLSECGYAVKFYCELIDSMRNAEFKPDWEMGVYPTEQLLQDSIEKQTLYFSFLDNCLVGAMILNNDSDFNRENVKWQIDAKTEEIMVIHLFAVSSSYQGKGIGRQMVANAIEICKNDAIKAIRLDVLKKNIPAAKLYLSTGFQYIDSIKMFYEDTGLADFELYELVL